MHGSTDAWRGLLLCPRMSEFDTDDGGTVDKDEFFKGLTKWVEEKRVRSTNAGWLERVGTNPLEDADTDEPLVEDQDPEAASVSRGIPREHVAAYRWRGWWQRECGRTAAHACESYSPRHMGLARRSCRRVLLNLAHCEHHDPFSWVSCGVAMQGTSGAQEGGEEEEEEFAGWSKMKIAAVAVAKLTLGTLVSARWLRLSHLPDFLHVCVGAHFSSVPALSHWTDTCLGRSHRIVSHKSRSHRPRRSVRRLLTRWSGPCRASPSPAAFPSSSSRSSSRPWPPTAPSSSPASSSHARSAARTSASPSARRDLEHS